MLVDTNMSKVKNRLSVKPDFFVKQALRSVGHVIETTGCLFHEVQALIFGLPGFLCDKLADGRNMVIRSIVLKRKGKEASEKME
uniref:Uncharacterized protein n=1 Tax=Acrobeloides nanus TaxID=290746 RepID=A0A914C7U1_9BILA